MGALETISDLVAIIRDVLIIIVIIGMVLGVLSAIAMVSQLSSQMAAEGGMLPFLIGSVLGGGMGMPSEMTPQQMQQYYTAMGGGKYEMDATTQKLINEVGEAYSANDTELAIQKLDDLKSHFQSKGWNDAAELTEDIKQATIAGNQQMVEMKAMQLSMLFKEGIQQQYK